MDADILPKTKDSRNTKSLQVRVEMAIKVPVGTYDKALKVELELPKVLKPRNNALWNFSLHLF